MEKILKTGIVFCFVLAALLCRADSLNGKGVWTLWDSLGHNTFQKKLVQISGCKWYADLNVKNDKPIAWGGSASMPDGDAGTQVRARNLVSYRGKYPIDIILIENVNDRNFLKSGLGSIADKPFMRSQRIVYFPETSVMQSAEEVSAFVRNHFAEMTGKVAADKRQSGTILSIPYYTAKKNCGSRITFSGTAEKDGNISFIWAKKKYSIPVNKGMSAEDVLQKCLQYQYGATSRVAIDRKTLGIFYYRADARMRITAFDGGRTGINAEFGESDTFRYCNLYYMGENADDWNRRSAWTTQRPSLYASYKGVIEYLKRELPDSRIYFVLPFAVSVDFSDTSIKKDGVYSQELFEKTSIFKQQKKLHDVQREICEYYHIPCLDLAKESPMNITNIEKYFNSKNVHPRPVGYDCYAETLCKMLNERLAAEK